MCKFKVDGVVFDVEDGANVVVRDMVYISTNIEVITQEKQTYPVKTIKHGDRGYVLDQAKKFGEINMCGPIVAGAAKSIYSAFKVLGWKASITHMGGDDYMVTRIE